MSTNKAIGRLEAAVHALGEVDLADWSDAALHGHLEELSAALCEVDGHLARLADAVRARGFRVAEAGSDERIRLATVRTDDPGPLRVTDDPAPVRVVYQAPVHGAEPAPLRLIGPARRARRPVG